MERSRKIIEKIKSENIQPIPKWYFTVKNGLIWLVFVISVIFGAMAFSVVLFAIQQTDFNLLTHLSHSRFEMMLGLLPYFWIIALAISLAVAVFSVQNSKRGYKFTWVRLFGFSTGISILLGTLFFTSGGAQWLEQKFMEQIPVYESIREKKIKMWMQPEAGYLCGTIQEHSDQSFHLLDFADNIWEISYQDAFMPPSVQLKKGEVIKLIGQVIEAEHFLAEEIRPWGGNGQGKGRRNPVQRKRQMPE